VCGVCVRCVCAVCVCDDSLCVSPPLFSPLSSMCVLRVLLSQGAWWEDGCKHVLVSLGTQGLIWAYAHKGSGVIIASHRAVAGGRPMDMHDCTGAGR
jgi:hypothetical protein